MKILLINSPNPHKTFNENLDFVDSEFGVFPPLDLCYVAAILKKAGNQCNIIDIKAEKLSKEQVLKKTFEYKPDLLGFNIHSLYTFFDVLSIARFLKQKSKLPVIIGGYALRTHYREIMSYCVFDYAVLGSAENILPIFIERFAKGATLLNLRGLVYRVKGRLVVQLPDSFDESFEKLPIPDISSLVHKKYYSFISKYKNFTIMLTSFACPCECTYCAINHFSYSKRSLNKVLAEIKRCVREHNVREIDFFDAFFTANNKYVIRLCRELIRQKINIKWSCRTNINSVNNELLQLMARAGCIKIYYGIESCKQEILSVVKKDLKLTNVYRALYETKRAGIKTLGFFMIGLPGETRKDIIETIEFAKSLPLDYAQFSMMIAKPNTKIEKTLTQDKYFWKKYVLGKTKERRIETPWTDLSYKEIQQLTRRAYMEFYFRPLKIIRYILDIRSIDEFIRYFKASIEALFYR